MSGSARRKDFFTRWQTACIPVYGAWAAFVVVAFGALFGFD